MLWEVLASREHEEGVLSKVPRSLHHMPLQPLQP